MKLSDLFFNRFLYKAPQDVATMDSSTMSANVTPSDVKPVASGNSVFDINTNSQLIDGAQLNPDIPIPQSVLDIAVFGWTQTCVFSVTDADTISWGSGTFTSADGSSVYSISAGNTGNMSALTYVYLDINVSKTAYQISTSITAPIGIGKVLIAVCRNGTSTATYNLVQASQIVGDNILANTISAQKMNVSQLSAITADLGSITAGTITGALIKTNNTGTRLEMNGASNEFFVYYAGDLRASFAGDSLSFYGPGSVGGGAISSYGTNQLDVAVGGNSDFEFNENAFEPITDRVVDCGRTGHEWANVNGQFINASGALSIAGDPIYGWADVQGYLDLSSYATLGDLSSYMPISGGTFTGDVSVGSYTFRVGGHLYMNSGNNNVYIYSTGSNLSFKDGTGTYASLSALKTAILPTSRGYNAVYCMESPEVWFMDFTREKNKVSSLFKEITSPPYRFIKCEDGWYQVWGKRKGFEETRFESKTYEEYLANEKFLNMNKPPVDLP